MDRREALKRVSWLVGGSVSAPLAAAVLGGCQTEPDTATDWTPQFLSAEQDALVAEVTELIIPATDTPGAKDVLVHRLIDHLLATCYPEADQQRFVEGLAQLEADAEQAYGDPFVELTTEQQTEILTQTEARDQQKEGLAFFPMMKELTLLGYFSSEPGATQALEYKLVYGRYDGCVPLQEATGGKAWANA